MADPKAKAKAVVCANVQLPPGVHNFETDDTGSKTTDATDPIKRIIYMDDRIVPGSFYVEAAWAVGSVPRVHPVHYHDHDEIVGFVGSNMDDPTDLGGEIDFVIDGEKITITRTCFIYVPAGVKHGGLCFRKIDRPVFQIAMLRQNIYSSVPPT
jgi:quercetin dioxygenase-like cupin family protein